MNRREDVRREIRVHGLSTLARDAEAAAEQGLGRRRAEAYEHLGLDDRELGVEPRPARRDLRPRRLCMDPALAARLPLEVLDHVRHVRERPVDARLVERLVEQTSRRSDKRAALAVLTVARLLADEHYLRALRAFTEDCLSCRTPERAGLTAVHRLPQGGEVQALGAVLRRRAGVDRPCHSTDRYQGTRFLTPESAGPRSVGSGGGQRSS